ncbi:MAG: hypothetical protein Q4B99_02000 [Clostridia bacterium]|nr:hypothetical protein [Clostridia bacterium]
MPSTDKKQERYTLIALLAIVLLGYLLIHDLSGGTLLQHNAWDSYTLQAMAWREGRLDLGRNYDHLELACYEGLYYVSFPPTPTLVMLPLTYIFGYNTPNNIVVMLYAIGAAIFIYRSLLLAAIRPMHAALLSALAVFGSGAMWMSTIGGVWFQAQLLNLLLCSAAVYCALKNRRFAAYLLVAFAVGCRPFSLLVFPVFFIAFLSMDCDGLKGKPFREIARAALTQWKYLLAPALVGVAYMVFNYVRFGNVFEFGHNYLPEFLEAEHGQFNIVYIPQNLYNILLRFVWFEPNMQLDYPLFDGFCFIVANPIFIIFLSRLIADIVRKRMEPVRIAANAAMLLILILLCAHKTFGGWQFGARYTVDLIPLGIFFLVWGAQSMVADLPTAFNADSVWILRPAERLICCLGIMFNVYGAIAMNIA